MFPSNNAAFVHRIFNNSGYFPMRRRTNRHANRHTALIGISDLLEPASIKGLRGLENTISAHLPKLGLIDICDSIGCLLIKIINSLSTLFAYSQMALRGLINDLFFTSDRGKMASKVSEKLQCRFYEARFLYWYMLLINKEFGELVATGEIEPPTLGL